MQLPTRLFQQIIQIRSKAVCKFEANELLVYPWKPFLYSFHTYIIKGVLVFFYPFFSLNLLWFLHYAWDDQSNARHSTACHSLYILSCAFWLGHSVMIPKVLTHNFLLTYLDVLTYLWISCLLYPVGWTELPTWLLLCSVKPYIQLRVKFLKILKWLRYIYLYSIKSMFTCCFPVKTLLFLQVLLEVKKCNFILSTSLTALSCLKINFSLCKGRKTIKIYYRCVHVTNF